MTEEKFYVGSTQKLMKREDRSPVFISSGRFSTSMTIEEARQLAIDLVTAAENAEKELRALQQATLPLAQTA